MIRLFFLSYAGWAGLPCQAAPRSQEALQTARDCWGNRPCMLWPGGWGHQPGLSLRPLHVALPGLLQSRQGFGSPCLTSAKGTKPLLTQQMKPKMNESCNGMRHQWLVQLLKEIISFINAAAVEPHSKDVVQPFEKRRMPLLQHPSGCHSLFDTLWQTRGTISCRYRWTELAH